MTAGTRPAVRRAPRQWGTTEVMPAARRYLDWIADLVTPQLGESALVVAAGRGDYARAWARRGASLTAAEEDPALVAGLRSRFAGDARVAVRGLDLRTEPAAGESGRHSCVVALNVLEHVPDDLAVLRRLAARVRPGGRVVVLVPAFRLAMSRFDRRIGHLRRYRRPDVVRLARAAGLVVCEARYFNAFGLLAWICGVRLLRLTPRPGPLLAAWDALAVPLVRRLETAVRVPFGKEILLVGQVPPGLARAGGEW